MKQFKDLNPTPEMQAAYDTGYAIGLRGEDPPFRSSYKGTDTERAIARIAESMGYAAGLNEHYRRKGIRTSFFSDEWDDGSFQ
jgi:hypothetical protein